MEEKAGDMYGKLMSVKDELVATYFETLTDVPLNEITQIMQGHPKEAKVRLAKEIVTLCHNKEAAEAASSGVMKAGDAREIKVSPGTKLRDIAQELGVSSSELRRLVEQGAIEVVGGDKLSSIDVELVPSTIKVGKHRFFKIRVG